MFVATGVGFESAVDTGQPTVHEIQLDAGVFTDDTIQAKPHMDESELVCWHYDHSQGRHVKGINLLNGLYHAQVAFNLIRKSIQYCEARETPQRGEQERADAHTCQHNQIPFAWVLTDRWFAASENMIHIKQTHHKDFVVGIKSNRLVALSQQDREQGRYTRIDQLPWTEQQTFTGWLKGVSFPVTLAAKSLQTKTRVKGFCIWSVVSLTGAMTPLQRGIKHDGRLRFSTNRSSPMPHSLSHPREHRPRRRITYSPAWSVYSNWNN